MFYPKSQIKTNLFTNGGEYIYASNNLPYSGDYFITGDGKIYTGKNPNNKPNYLLIPDSINLTEAPNPEGETLPSSYYIADDYYYYAKGIDINSIGPPPSLPTQIFPTPTEKDYQIGEIQRYFVKKANEIKYIEISQEEFEQYLTQQSTVSYQLYIPFSFPWVITGKRANAYTVNKNTIKRVETNNKIQGLSAYFKGKYDQLFKYSNNENLYTDGTEFLNPLNRKPYIGFYHIGPEGKPMEGPQHTDKSHSFLIPISKTYKTESTGSTYVTQSWYDLRYGGLNGPIYKPLPEPPQNPYPDAFITTWKTTSPNEEIKIGLESSQTYNFTVYWGDGDSEEITSSGDISHTYQDAGEYRVIIDGIFPRILMERPNATRDKIIAINQWGNNQWTSMYRAFKDCINLYRCNPSDTPNLSIATSLREMFRNAGSNSPNLYMDNIYDWDISNVNDISYMFRDASSFNQNINSWNTNNISTLAGIFWGASSFTQPLNNWDVSNVINMYRAFFNATSFNQDISSWDVSSVTNMRDTFKNTSFNQNISSWDVGNVTDMAEMFRNTPFNQPIGSWDVSNVTNMQSMLRTTPFNQDISDWDIRNVSDFNNFMSNSFALNPTNYSALLIQWVTLPPQSNITVSFGDAKYTTAAASAHNTLSTTYNWTITDGGPL